MSEDAEICADCGHIIKGDELRKRQYYSYFNPDRTIGDKKGQRLLCTNCQREHDSEQARTQDFQDPAPDELGAEGDDIGSAAAQRGGRRR